MSLLPPVGWADVATKDDLLVMTHDFDERFARASAESRADVMELRNEVLERRADMHKELRQVQPTVITAMAVLLGLFTAVGRALG